MDDYRPVNRDLNLYSKLVARPCGKDITELQYVAFSFAISNPFGEQDESWKF